MFGRLVLFCLLIGCSLCTIAATAQEVVHALTGTVLSMNPGKAIEVNTADGDIDFKDLTRASVSLEFDKGLRAQALPADRYNTKGGQVIVYYFGEGSQSTAVALQGLGSGPVKRTIGTVAKFDKHQHLLTVESASGGVQIFQIAPMTVVETSEGVVEGRRFDPRKRDQVRVTAAPAPGTQTALFVYAK